MLTVTRIKNNPAEVIEHLRKRNFDATAIIKEVLALDEQRRHTKKQLDEVLAESNSYARQIGQLFKEKKAEEAQALKEKTRKLKQESAGLSESFKKITSRQQELLLQVPNIPHSSVPAGDKEEDNAVIHSSGDVPGLEAKAMPHWDLAARYDIIDFDLGNKVTGAGFPFYKGKGAMLQRALINFFLDSARRAGYTEIQPPIFINEASGYGTGQLPDKEGQMYHIAQDGLYPVPTAEVPITNMYRDMILDAGALPVKNTGYTPCFRREAGSYGKDVKGLNRLHQFDKVEVVCITRPGNSYDMLEEMKTYVGGLLSELNMPFRILRLCGGDMGFAAALTYDFEVYSAAQERWLEVSSVSNFETFQSNRMKLRYKDEEGKKHLAHTLNGSALALPRIVAAMLENNQTSEGIIIPEPLVKYTGFEKIG